MEEYLRLTLNKLKYINKLFEWNFDSTLKILFTTQNFNLKKKSFFCQPV